MYLEDLLSAEHVESFLYHQVDTTHGRLSLSGCVPLFFVAQTDECFKGNFFPPGLSAFMLTTPYNEKVCLTFFLLMTSPRYHRSSRCNGQ
jgi:hypothetical protein